MLVISIACLFSTMTSPRSSLSSGYCSSLLYLVSLSNTLPFALSDVAKYTSVDSSSCNATRSSSSVSSPTLSSISVRILSMILRSLWYNTETLYRIWYTKRSFFFVENSFTRLFKNAWSTGVSSVHIVIISSAVKIIPRGIVVYDSLSWRISIEGISTRISVYPSWSSIRELSSSSSAANTSSISTFSASAIICPSATLGFTICIQTPFWIFSSSWIWRSSVL